MHLSKSWSVILLSLLTSGAIYSQEDLIQQQEFLVKYKSSDMQIKALNKMKRATFQQNGQTQRIEVLTPEWVKLSGSPKSLDQTLQNQKQEIEYVQPDYKINLIENYQVDDETLRQAYIQELTSTNQLGIEIQSVDNPSFIKRPQGAKGKDPLTNKQWGMIDIGGPQVWAQYKSAPPIIVAVIDTGVDYNHPDLNANMWRNPGETGLDANGRDKSSNKIDDDGNGYVDDVVGYDFYSNDSNPYDNAVGPLRLLIGGGNPGHGTHCAGNIAAVADNGIGISGVAPNAKIMALRFLGNNGGRTSAAIKAIKYAVDNGAKVLSNSWGSEGEDPSEGSDNKALKDIIAYAESKNVLFVAAAGNGRRGKGYNNDSDPRPAYPASYQINNIISVAAIDENNQLGMFSNWGFKTVHIGAPGVKVFSTMVGGKYSDKVIPFIAKWEGTSMATPHVSGAAALYWSMHPEKTVLQVKEAVLNSAVKIPALQNKVVSGGKLNLISLMQQK